jgi:hypothetical protein
MALAYQKQLEEAEVQGLSFEERFGLLVDHHWTWRENQALAHRLKQSKLETAPCVEDINYRDVFRPPLLSERFGLFLANTSCLGEYGNFRISCSVRQIVHRIAWANSLAVLAASWKVTPSCGYKGSRIGLCQFTAAPAWTGRPK